MIPVVTPAEMAEIDRQAPESEEVLIRRAAGHVARVAIQMMGGAYGKRVLVVAGPGNNGADGRVAAELLGRRGVRATVVDPSGIGPSNVEGATEARRSPVRFDLVIDAAFGTGFRGSYEFPVAAIGESGNDRPMPPVLAVDLPSGVSGLNGVGDGRPIRAARTVAFAALKPGHLFAAGKDLSGSIDLVDIGLDVSGAGIHLVEDSDIAEHIPVRRVEDHKWRHAVWLVAGSPGMFGASRLSAEAALRSGAGYVRLSSPGVENPLGPIEAVSFPLPADGWAEQVRTGSDRFAVVTVGPGLGTADQTRRQVRELASADGFALVLDGDALTALGGDASAILSGRESTTILTPHDGEFERLTGEAPGVDRIAAAKDLAHRCDSVVLLKGSTTVVAAPRGEVLIVTTGDSRLATAGTGDVLTGIISGHMALGAQPLWAAAAGAHLHGLAGRMGPGTGLVASDLIDLLPRARAKI